MGMTKQNDSVLHWKVTDLLHPKKTQQVSLNVKTVLFFQL